MNMECKFIIIVDMDLLMVSMILKSEFSRNVNFKNENLNYY
jgi:hypothetical protein